MNKVQPLSVQRDIAARLAYLLEILADDSEPGEEAVLVDDLLLDVGNLSPRRGE